MTILLNIFLISGTIEQILEVEMDEHLGYENHSLLDTKRIFVA